MSSKVARENVELTVGVVLLFVGWFTVLLMAIGVLSFENPDLVIAISIFCYAVSLAGLFLASHWLVTTLVAKKRKRERQVK